MEKDVIATDEGSEALANESTPAASFPDTKAQFELWLDTLRPSRPVDSTSSKFPGVEEQAADFFVECVEGTACRIEFTGVLNIGGVLSGSLRTGSGTLVTHAPGRISGDIDLVGWAFIDCAIYGNINASGRVVLNRNAKVFGNICAAALSIRPGAVFEGDCGFPEILGDDVDAANTEAAEAVRLLSAIAMRD
jgi:cytoskeletal protein CcmA (bactofilin family)